jgi:hypothetical protein
MQENGVGASNWVESVGPPIFGTFIWDVAMVLLELVNRVLPSRQEPYVREVRSVREFYSGGWLPSRYLLDLLYRILMGWSEWVFALAEAVRMGSLTFARLRDSQLSSGRKRPPIFITPRQAKKEIECAVLEGKVRWRR